MLPTSILLPGLAGVATSALYLAASATYDRSHGWRIFAVGTLVAVVGWILFSPFCRRLTTAAGSNTAAYGNLCIEYDRVAGRLEGLAPGTIDEPSYIEARLQLSRAREELYPSREPRAAVRWVLCTGYPAVWGRIHRADEALFDLETDATALGMGIYDELRLLGARIPEKEELLNKLRVALSDLDPANTRYLYQTLPLTLHPQGVSIEPPTARRRTPTVQLAIRGRTLLGRPPQDDPGREQRARAALRQVRLSINEFRDYRREGLVRARNSLFATTLFTGWTAYLVLGLAVIQGVPQASVVAGLAFYLVGATVGLFRHLQNASARDTIVEEDFGLSYARLIQLPLFAGIAAVAGVALTALLPSLAPAVNNAKPPPAPSIATIFNLRTNPSYLVVAAVFGLTPNLLIGRLQQQAESYKADLKSSEAAEHHR
jgi:hypothetical protein